MKNGKLDWDMASEACYEMGLGGNCNQMFQGSEGQLKDILGLYPQENGIASKMVSNWICFLQNIAVKLESESRQVGDLKVGDDDNDCNNSDDTIVALTPIIYWMLIQGPAQG